MRTLAVVVLLVGMAVLGPSCGSGDDGGCTDATLCDPGPPGDDPCQDLAQDDCEEIDVCQWVDAGCTDCACVTTPCNCPPCDSPSCQLRPTR